LSEEQTSIYLNQQALLHAAAIAVISRDTVYAVNNDIIRAKFVGTTSDDAIELNVFGKITEEAEA